MSTEFPENELNNQETGEDKAPKTDLSQDNDARLDNNTQALLDELDDEIEEDGIVQDTATAELLQTLDQLKPQTVTSSSEDDVKVETDVSDEEISADDVATSPAPTSVPESIISEPTENYRYRIAVSLPTLLQAAIDEALEEVGLIEDKQAGVFQWQAAFQSDTPQTIATILDEWVQTNLPIPTKMERVHSAVVGTQRYIGGWTLGNSDSIYKAQEKLTTQLADIITPETDDDSTFRAILPVHNAVPADRFPQLIGHLQRRFKAEAWKIEALELLRLPLDKKGKPEADATWSVMGTFRTQV